MYQAPARTVSLKAVCGREQETIRRCQGSVSDTAGGTFNPLNVAVLLSTNYIPFIFLCLPALAPSREVLQQPLFVTSIYRLNRRTPSTDRGRSINVWKRFQ